MSVILLLLDPLSSPTCWFLVNGLSKRILKVYNKGSNFPVPSNKDNKDKTSGAPKGSERNEGIEKRSLL